MHLSSPSCFDSSVATELERLFFFSPPLSPHPVLGERRIPTGMRSHRITISDSLPAVNLASCSLLEKNGGKKYIYKKASSG